MVYSISQGGSLRGSSNPSALGRCPFLAWVSLVNRRSSNRSERGAGVTDCRRLSRSTIRRAMSAFNKSASRAGAQAIIQQQPKSSPTLFFLIPVALFVLIVVLFISYPLH